LAIDDWSGCISYCRLNETVEVTPIVNRQSPIVNSKTFLLQFLGLDIHKEDDLDNKRQYEVVFIVDPAADDDEVTRLTDTLKQIATDQGGVVTKSESMGRRQLAYEILHKTEGNFVLMEIDGSGREIAELERRMRVNDRILRYLTVRVDEDRRRAEKFRTKRARKAEKRPGSAQRQAQAPTQEFASDENYEG
jgi:small subunit ribosomal protein S6